MRTFFTTTMLIVMLLGLFSTSGCLVWKKDYDALASHNLALTNQVDRLEQELAQAEAAKKELEARLAGSDDPSMIALLEQELRELQVDYDGLLAKYRDLRDAAPGPLPTGMSVALEALAAQHSDMIEFVPSHGMIKFKADLTFPRGQDALQPAAVTAMRQLARIVNSTEAQGFNVYIAGHTDDIPIKKPETRRKHPNNWYLSVHRAVAVEEALEKAGVGAKRLAVVGFSEYHPTVANAPNHKGSPANRRVEIWIVPPRQFLTGAR